MRERKIEERIANYAMACMLPFAFFFIFMMTESVLIMALIYLMVGFVISSFGTLVVYGLEKRFHLFWKMILLYPMILLSERVLEWMKEGYPFHRTSKEKQDACSHAFDKNHTWCPKCGLRKTKFDPPVELKVSDQKGFSFIELLLVIIIATLCVLIVVKAIEKDPPKFPTQAVNVQDIGNDWYYFDLDGNTYLMRDTYNQYMIARVKASARIHIEGE